MDRSRSTCINLVNDSRERDEEGDNPSEITLPPEQSKDQGDDNNVGNNNDNDSSGTVIVTYHEETKIGNMIMNKINTNKTMTQGVGVRAHLEVTKEAMHRVKTKRVKLNPHRVNSIKLATTQTQAFHCSSSIVPIPFKVKTFP